MKEIALTIIFTFLLIGKLEAFPSMGPVGNVIITAVYECPENLRPTGDVITWSGNLTDVKGKKVLSGTLTTKIPVDATTNYRITLKKLENGSWKKYIEKTGYTCADVQKVFPKFWSKVVAQIKPDPGRKCPAKPGTYSLENFYASPKDLDVKAIFYGKLLLELIAYDKDKKITICVISELISQAAL